MGNVYSILVVFLCLVTPAGAADRSAPGIPNGAGGPESPRDAASLRGRVLTLSGDPVPGLIVVLADPRDGSIVRETVSGADGSFVLTPAPAGTWTVLSRSGDGLAEARVEVKLEPNQARQVDLRLRFSISETVTVTDSRGARLKRETPASVGAVDQEILAEARPSHASEVMGLVPGVWVNTTGGEGHQTAIRQPLTTSPVYLYLEDGVPTRSTGFFNHNALYEVNLPAAEAIEVTRGPGSALFGSDALGGVVNVVTRSSLDRSGLAATVEGGDAAFRRVMTTANISNGKDGLRVTFNGTRTEGWRDATGYDRVSGTLRWDRARSDSLSKVLIAANVIDQQTAGSSALSEIDYLRTPSANLTPISFRSVRAYRASFDYQGTFDRASVNVVPYARYDSMDLLANWTLTYDPTVYTTENSSFGVLAKAQREFSPLRTSIVAGVDLDVSPGMRVEDVVRPKTTPSTLPSGRPIFSSYTAGDRVYDYDVTFVGWSPYVHAEVSPTDRMRFSIGLRADRLRYDYDDRLTTPDTRRHRRPADAERTFTHLSPKLGWTWQAMERVSVWGSYRHAFRAPSEGQLFRQGAALNTIDLDPVRADNLEAGARVALRPGVAFDVSVYQLDKGDDILTFRDPADGSTQSVNAGHTRHRGIEAGLDATIRRAATVKLAYSYAKHTYEGWVVDPAAGVDYSGFEQELAPRHIGNASLTLLPQSRARVGLDLAYLGPYWLDAANTTRYTGHVLLNLRAGYEVTGGVSLFARVMNLADRLYAETGSYTRQRGREFAPGRPRTAFVGAEVRWSGR
jgi:outer membrane receptor protein involved in Fe transport